MSEKEEFVNDVVEAVACRMEAMEGWQKFLKCIEDNGGSVDFETYKANNPDESEEQARENFDNIDEDKDGMVTREEVHTYLVNMFKAQLLEALPEIIGPIREAMQELFKAMDADGDEFLSPEEFAAIKDNEMVNEHIEDAEMIEKFLNFEACDADGDGKVSWDEFWAHCKKCMKKKVKNMLINADN